MIAPELLNILRCPESRQSLTVANSATVTKLNSLIAGSSLKNRGGKTIAEPIDSGLVRADGKYLYPIRKNIPVMLVDEAIELAGK